MNEPLSRPHLREELSGEPPPPAEETKPQLFAPPPPTLRQLKHHETCPGIRGKECTCAANLKLVEDGTFKPLEKKMVGWKEPGKITKACDQCGGTGIKLTMSGELQCPECKGEKNVTRQGFTEVSAELWRVDDGKTEVVTRPNPNNPRQKPIQVEVSHPPRWVCTRCGFSMRGVGISHRCDKAAVALATRVVSLADGLTKEELTNGTLRLIIWRDPEGIYHLAEELVRDGKVAATLERDKDITYGVLEGALLGAVVDLWS